MVNTFGQKKRGVNMGSLKNILQHCKEYEKQYKDFGVNPNDPGRLINKGWIECAEFFLRNFDLREKVIEDSPIGTGFAQKDNKQKGE